jgi:hypothetical protein
MRAQPIQGEHAPVTKKLVVSAASQAQIWVSPMRPLSFTRGNRTPSPPKTWTRKLAWHAAVAGGVALVAGAESVVVGAAFAYALALSLIGPARGSGGEAAE